MGTTSWYNTEPGNEKLTTCAPAHLEKGGIILGKPVNRTTSSSNTSSSFHVCIPIKCGQPESCCQHTVASDRHPDHPQRHRVTVNGSPLLQYLPSATYNWPVNPEPAEHSKNFATLHFPQSLDADTYDAFSTRKTAR
ncbi:hypothetical protein JOQ06_015897 [Pogonophryne albipinna]|uniref:Ataxin-1 N-terminal domain-containing protein n=1 Tax=Pogonophryne albipinna TaxID=1090488 RepID=A0AAD6AN32_9TELE|nr:hypothetical protein JOQ06_015897 [Pogonophryne albipinna]